MDTKDRDRSIRVLQRRIGYSDEELRRFRENPRNLDVLAKARDLADTRIVLRVVESRGCNSRHRVGDKLYFDAFGNLLSELSPDRVCVYALNNAVMLVFAATEMLLAGTDPNQIRFRRAGCSDVGLDCGGWGRIVLELEVEGLNSSLTQAEEQGGRP